MKKILIPIFLGFLTALIYFLKDIEKVDFLYMNL